MTPEESSIDLKGLAQLVEMEFSLNSNERKSLNLALQSIDKRIQFCKYHYIQVKLTSDEKSLSLERFLSIKHHGITNRTAYEANIFGFIHNLHSLVDSFPYVLNIIYQVIDNIESPNIGWNDDFLKKYESFTFYQSLQCLSDDETFKKLKGVINKAKHKYLIRIQNNYTNLTFEDFTYFYNGDVIYVRNQNVKSFLENCHNDLIPKFISVYNLIKINKENDIIS